MNEYKIRELKWKDTYTLSKIMSKMKIEVSVEGKSQAQFGADLIMNLVQNLHLAEAEANTFLGSLVGLTAEEFAELPMSAITNILGQLKENKDILAFFTQGQ